MDAIQIHIEVPPGCDPCDLKREIEVTVHESVQRHLRKRDLRDELILVLTSDNEMTKYVTRATAMRHPPIVRASTYGNKLIGRRQDEFAKHLVEAGLNENDERRPVIMRGAFRLLQNKYETKSAYAHEIIERYFRAKKFTSFSRRGTYDAINSACAKLATKMTFRNPRYLGIDPPSHKDERGSIWLRGKQITVTYQQYSYLKKLCDLIQKSDDLESRLVRIVSRSSHNEKAYAHGS